MYISNLRRILKKIYKEHGNKILEIDGCLIDVSKIKVCKDTLYITTNKKTSDCKATVMELLVKTGKYPLSNKIKFNDEERFIITVKNFR